MKITDIKPYPQNAKKHPKKQVEQIAESIKAFGFNQPIVIDKKGVVIVGHGRLEAAKLLKIADVPVIKLDISEKKAMAYRLADNKLNESDWDMKQVIEELKALDSMALVDLTGFSRDLLAEDDDWDDVLPPTPPIARTKLGDVYTLGQHRLICGSATDEKTVGLLMGKVHADMVFTDPPYNVNYSSRGDNLKSKGKESIMNDAMTPEDFADLLSASFTNYAMIMKKGAGAYVFHSTSTAAQFEKAMTDAGFAIKMQLIWNKPTASMGWGDYRWKHEPFFYAGIKDNDVQFYGDRKHTSVVDLQDDEAQLMNWVKTQKRLEKMGLSTIWTMKRDNVQEYKHPTQKPVELIGYALSNSSKRGDIVVDLFGGSGSTLIACQKMDRVCYTTELDPIFCDVIVQRYVDYTGEEDIELNGEPIHWKKTPELGNKDQDDE